MPGNKNADIVNLYHMQKKIQIRQSTIVAFGAIQDRIGDISLMEIASYPFHTGWFALSIRVGRKSADNADFSSEIQMVIVLPTPAGQQRPCAVDGRDLLNRM